MVRKGVWIAVIIGIVAACGTGIKAHAAGDILAAGTAAPNFSLPSQEDASVSLSQYKGKWVVLYFYPKDMTTGCTIEAHNFQRDLPKYDALNAVVDRKSTRLNSSHLGISYAVFFFNKFFDPVIGPSTPTAIAMIAGQSGETQRV